MGGWAACTSLEASGRVTWARQAGGSASSHPFLEGGGGDQRSRSRSWGPAEAGRLQPTEWPDYVQRRAAAWPLPNSEWEILGSEAGAGLGLPDPLGSWRPEPPRSTSPKAVYTQGWECLFFLIDFLQINPWPAERGSQQQLFTQCL